MTSVVFGVWFASAPEPRSQRPGRNLVTLLLCEDQRVLSRPLLYLSLYLKENRDEYYERLTSVRIDGAWEDWLKFFLEGVIAVARSATDTTMKIVSLVNADRQRVMSLGKASASAARLHDLVTRQVLFTVPEAASELKLSEVTTGKATAHLENLGIVVEVTGKARNRVFVYDGYLRLLQADEPVPYE